MNQLETVWQRLLTAARRAPRPEAPAAPIGFANRVAARWLAGDEAENLELWLCFARRTLVGAAVILAGVLALNYAMFEGTWTALDGSAPLFELVLGL